MNKEITYLIPSMHGRKVRCKIRGLTVKEGVIIYTEHGFTDKPSFYIAQDIVQGGRPRNPEENTSQYKNTWCMQTEITNLVTNGVRDIFFLDSENSYIPFL